MMYGSYALRKELLNTALSYADKMNVRLVFGATIGSVSRGMNFCDSDYDARFLFLNKNDESIYIPWETPESALHFKFRESDGRIRSEKTLDECLPFWEATSFFQFLKHPSFTDDVSLGLYDSFARTLFSPYTWDPYGLQQKLIPLINESFNSAWLFEFHRKNLNEFLAREKKDASHKEYLNALYSACALLWIKKYNTFCPAYLPQLLCMTAPYVVQNEAKRLVPCSSCLRDETIERSIILDDFLLEAAKCAIPAQAAGDIEEILSHIYSLLFMSVNDVDYSIYMGGGIVYIRFCFTCFWAFFCPRSVR